MRHLNNLGNEPYAMVCRKWIGNERIDALWQIAADCLDRNEGYKRNDRIECKWRGQIG